MRLIEQAWWSGAARPNTAMAIGFQLTIRGFRPRCRTWIAAAAIVVGAFSEAPAQDVVATVNGEPITTFDRDQRSKLLEAASPTHQTPLREVILHQLIDEKVVGREAGRWGLGPAEFIKIFSATERSKQVLQEMRRQSLIEYR